MKKQTDDYQAREYVYNLNNCAKENGFAPDESWELSLATVAEKLAIERSYYPTLSTKALPGGLPELLMQIKTQMRKLQINFANMPLPAQDVLNHLQYIVAFNPARQRK